MNQNVNNWSTNRGFNALINTFWIAENEFSGGNVDWEGVTYGINPGSCK